MNDTNAVVPQELPPPSDRADRGGVDRAWLRLSDRLDRRRKLKSEQAPTA